MTPSFDTFASVVCSEARVMHEEKVSKRDVIVFAGSVLETPCP
jgi:hypothetical protein